MKLSLSVPILAGLAFGNPVRHRDIATIQGVISDLGKSLAKLDASVKAFDGKDPTAIATDSSTLITTIQTGTQQIQATKPVQLTDSLQLQNSITPVKNAATALGNDLIAKKSQFETVGLCTAIQSQAGDISKQSKALTDAVTQKLPAIAQQIAAGQISGVTGPLDQVNKAYAPSNCTDKVPAASPGGGMSGNMTMAGMGKLRIRGLA